MQQRAMRPPEYLRRMIRLHGIQVTDASRLPVIPDMTASEARKAFQALVAMGLAAWDEDTQAYVVEPVEEEFQENAREPNARRLYQLRTKTSQRSDGTWASGTVISTFSTLDKALASGRGRLRTHPWGLIVRGPGGKVWEVTDDGETIVDRDREPNGGYYVWVLGADGQPLLEGPYGPHDLDKAKQLARIGATEGDHNRAVSRGLHPTEPSFELVREYEARSGERLL